MRLQPQDIRLTPFDPARDSQLLASWLRRPHVTRWWGDPVEAAEEASRLPAGGDEALIEAAGRPVGYVRWQVPSREELDAAGLLELPDDVIDIDIVIGDAGLLDMGIGSRALSILRARLAREGEPTLMLCTSVDNARAVGAFEKAGFVRRRQFVDTDGGLYWLLVSDAGPAAPEETRSPRPRQATL